MGLSDQFIHIAQHSFAKDAILTADYLADVFYVRCIDPSGLVSLTVDTY